MENIFIRMLIGHFVADYLFQSKTMALKKSEKSFKGFAWSVGHCVIYAFCVSLFLWDFRPMTIALIFISHWPIDRWSLASKWLKFIKGRDMLEEFNSQDKYRDIALSFSCLVYKEVDFTLHMVLLWFVAKFI